MNFEKSIFETDLIELSPSILESHVFNEKEIGKIIKTLNNAILNYITLLSNEGYIKIIHNDIFEFSDADINENTIQFKSNFFQTVCKTVRYMVSEQLLRSGKFYHPVLNYFKEKIVEQIEESDGGLIFNIKSKELITLNDTKQYTDGIFYIELKINVNTEMFKNVDMLIT